MILIYSVFMNLGATTAKKPQRFSSKTEYGRILMIAYLNLMISCLTSSWGNVEIANRVQQKRPSALDSAMQLSNQI